MRYDVAVVMSRMQITLAPEMLRRARQRASSLRISLAEYVRRLVAKDLGAGATDPTSVFDLGFSGGSDVAIEKRSMIAKAFSGLPKKQHPH